MNQRRHVLASIASLGAMSLLPTRPLWAQESSSSGARPSKEPRQRFRKVRLGDVEIVALYDGVTRLPLTERYVANAPFQEVKALATDLGLSTTEIELPFTGFLVVAGSRRILLDTGLGEFGTPRETTGGLLDSLRLAGFRPEEIDTVLISHFHADHISGLRNRAGDFVYPNAKVWVSNQEYNYWMSEQNMRAAPARKTAFELAQRVFTGMPESMIRRYEPGGEVAPGIRSVPAFGHTPGHTAFKVVSKEQVFHYIADMINVPAFFARHPEWSVASDMDAAAALQVRADFLQGLEPNALVGGFHFPFPAIGHLRKESQGYSFVPLP